MISLPFLLATLNAKFTFSHSDALNDYKSKHSRFISLVFSITIHSNAVVVSFDAAFVLTEDFIPDSIIIIQGFAKAEWKISRCYENCITTTNFPFTVKYYEQISALPPVVAEYS